MCLILTPHITYHIMCLLKVIKRVHLYMQVCAVFSPCSDVSPQQLLHPELDIHEAGLAERLQQRVHRGRVPRQPDQSELSIIVSTNQSSASLSPPIRAQHHCLHQSQLTSPTRPGSGRALISSREHPTSFRNSWPGQSKQICLILTKSIFTS